MLKYLALSLIAFSFPLVHTCNASANRYEGSGIWAIWARPTDYAGLSFIRGGQIVLQWADLETGPGLYNFSDLDNAVALVAGEKRKVTIQINGNHRPQYLYDIVPSLPQRLSVQIMDNNRSLMFWYPRHEKAYFDLLDAFAEHLQKSPYIDSILGIRLNWNAFGTEHYHVPSQFIPLENWNIPKSVNPESLVGWSDEVVDKYMYEVVDAHRILFSPWLRVLIRHVVPEAIVKDFKQHFLNGQFGFFQTNSYSAPFSRNSEDNAHLIYSYCKDGPTIGYAECLGSSFGDHGDIKNEMYFSPPQEIYWRLLFDLHKGHSVIAVYGEGIQPTRHCVVKAQTDGT